MNKKAIAKQIKVSCHHGDINNPNQLFYVEKLIERENDFIDIYEIDFVMFKNKIISSHDYDIDMIYKGSELIKWIDLIIIKNNKILWIDIKENLSIFCNSYNQFNIYLFFKQLEIIRKKIINDINLDIINFIWISCQETNLYDKIIEINNKKQRPNSVTQEIRENKWIIVYDIPSIDSYIYQIILGTIGLNCIINDSVYNKYIQLDLTQYKYISIDQSFFYDIHDLLEFINRLILSKNTNIVLYNFKLNIPPITIPDYNIIMQYDF